MASFMPPAGASRMHGTGDVAASRARFIEKRPGNLDYLLEKRYGWMNEFIAADDVGIEIGCGAGLSKQYIRSRRFELTDYADFDWLDRKVDALDLPYADASLDFIIESNVIHHLARPSQFVSEAHRVLKPGGRLLIQDVWGSFFLRALCRTFRTEGYSFDVDVFDPNCDCCDPENLWAGNNVVPNLLFADLARFSRAFGFQVLQFRHSEFLLFPLSGGVTSTVPVPNVPRRLLRIIDRLDDWITRMLPGLLALQMSAALVKV